MRTTRLGASFMMLLTAMGRDARSACDQFTATCSSATPSQFVPGEGRAIASEQPDLGRFLYVEFAWRPGAILSGLANSPFEFRALEPDFLFSDSAAYVNGIQSLPSDLQEPALIGFSRLPCEYVDSVCHEHRVTLAASLRRCRCFAERERGAEHGDAEVGQHLETRGQLCDILACGTQLRDDSRDAAFALLAAGYYLNASHARIAAALDAVTNDLLLRTFPEAPREEVGSLFRTWPGFRFPLLSVGRSDPWSPTFSRLCVAFQRFGSSQKPENLLIRRVEPALKRCPWSLARARESDVKIRATGTPGRASTDEDCVALCVARNNSWKHLPDSTERARRKRLGSHFVEWIWSLNALRAIADLWSKAACVGLGEKEKDDSVTCRP